MQLRWSVTKIIVALQVSRTAVFLHLPIQLVRMRINITMTFWNHDMFCLKCLPLRFVNWCHHASFPYRGLSPPTGDGFLNVGPLKRVLNCLELIETREPCRPTLVWWFLNVITRPTCSTFLRAALLSVIFLSCKFSAPIPSSTVETAAMNVVRQYIANRSCLLTTNNARNS